MDRKEFTKEIALRCQNNEAALFLGAGMSNNAGLPSWKKLFEPLAREIGIDLENTNYQLYDIMQTIKGLVSYIKKYPQKLIGLTKLVKH